MASTVAFPAASAPRDPEFLRLRSTSCTKGDHEHCHGGARLPNLTIECTCDCHARAQLVPCFEQHVIAA
jgi:hypothetical protein